MTVVLLAIFSQLYLLFHGVKIVRAWSGSTRIKSLLTVLVVAIIGSLFLIHVFFLIRPVSWVDPPRVAQCLLFYLPAVWSFGSIFAALLLASTHALVWLRGRMRRVEEVGATPDPLSGPSDPDRRRLLQMGVGGLVAAPIVLAGYGAFYAARDFQVKEIRVPFGRKLRVVQLTDIHAGLYMDRRDMKRYADVVRDLQPDLFVLTGDYISNSIAFLPGCLDEMARVRARYGTFAILGNHDLWYGKLGSLRKVFKRYRIPLLVNRNRVIETQEGPVAIAGLDDLRSGYPDLEATLRGLDPGVPTVLLSHRPEIFPEAAGRGVSLTLAGHYHGGQIKLSLPGGDLSLAHLRTPYVEGLHRIETSHLYVSAGIGTTFTPVRLNAPPEVSVLQLT